MQSPETQVQSRYRFPYTIKEIWQIYNFLNSQNNILILSEAFRKSEVFNPVYHLKIIPSRLNYLIPRWIKASPEFSKYEVINRKCKELSVKCS